MRRRYTASVRLAFSAAVILSAPLVYGQGLLTLETSVVGNVVTIDVTIEDNGGASDCAAFHLVRTTVLFEEPMVETRCIPRQIGTTTHRQFVDTLPANRAYHYTVVGMACFAPCVCPFESDQTAFVHAFGSPWGLGFHAYADTGAPESTPVAHGQVVSTGWAYPGYGLIGCPEATSWGGFASTDVLPYVDTGTDVVVYGSVSFDVQNGPMLWMTSATPWSCDIPVSVEERSWGAVKSLYR